MSVVQPFQSCVDEVFLELHGVADWQLLNIFILLQLECVVALLSGCLSGLALSDARLRGRPLHLQLPLPLCQIRLSLLSVRLCGSRLAISCSDLEPILIVQFLLLDGRLLLAFPEPHLFFLGVGLLFGSIFLPRLRLLSISRMSLLRVLRMRLLCLLRMVLPNRLA